ncbi:leucine-rich repeat extensin-like protein 3 [Panicum virgatum]|uniref:leucine-rich repeat extensin-like protein 3 n=1 Tax=Panicum virgatum TaxID=38727 RepID=UPI0019D6A2A0|nr:leucine-rich repeat extensin-like protein 3 [Panicum virgatum]
MEASGASRSFLSLPGEQASRLRISPSPQWPSGRPPHRLPLRQAGGRGAAASSPAPGRGAAPAGVGVEWGKPPLLQGARGERIPAAVAEAPVGAWRLRWRAEAPAAWSRPAPAPAGRPLTPPPRPSPAALPPPTVRRPCPAGAVAPATPRIPHGPSTPPQPRPHRAADTQPPAPPPTPPRPALTAPPTPRPLITVTAQFDALPLAWAEHASFMCVDAQMLATNEW